MSDLRLTNDHYIGEGRSHLIEVAPRCAEQISSLFVDWRVDDRIDPENFLR